MQQNVSIDQVVYATFWQRYAAITLDWVILSLPNIFIAFYFNWDNLLVQIFTHQFTSSAFLSALVTIGADSFYFALMESGASQATFGKMALNIKVTDLGGNRITFTRALVRNLVKYLSGLIFFLGFLMMRKDSRKQTLHDKIANTLVVKKKPVI